MEWSCLDLKSTYKEWFNRDGGDTLVDNEKVKTDGWKSDAMIRSSMKTISNAVIIKYGWMTACLNVCVESG